MVPLTHGRLRMFVEVKEDCLDIPDRHRLKGADRLGPIQRLLSPQSVVNDVKVFVDVPDRHRLRGATRLGPAHDGEPETEADPRILSASSFPRRGFGRADDHRSAAPSSIEGPHI